jgi:hypothetical protein
MDLWNWTVGMNWVIRVMHLGLVDRPFVPLTGIVHSFITRGTPHHAARETSISEGRKLNIRILPVARTAAAGFFYMSQSWDMGQIIWLPLRRKACWGFLHQKNPTASAEFEPVNSGTRGQHAVL